MYQPIQVPYVLNPDFHKYFNYKADVIPSLQDFLICLWEHHPITGEEKEMHDIIIADGCIDLLVDFKEQTIGFTGHSKTYFDNISRNSESYLGATFKPGAFEQLTGKPASASMDSFVPLEEIDFSFDMPKFFMSSFENQKAIFLDLLESLVEGKVANDFVKTFDRFSRHQPANASELYLELGYSPRQCQRLFLKHFGLSPKMVLSIIRFQNCLRLLTSDIDEEKSKYPSIEYYDQSHFIKDFKKYIGFTPAEYIQLCKDVAFLQYD